MPHPNKDSKMKITKIPFLFEFLLCVGFLVIVRASYYWMRFVDYTYGVYIFGIIIHAFVFYVIITIGLKIQKRTLASVIIFKKVNFKIWLAMFVCSIGFVLYMFYLHDLFASFRWGWNTDFDSIYDRYNLDKFDLFLSIIDSALIPAVCEEIMHKGLLYSSLRKRYSKIVAVIISSILFAALHLTELYFIPKLIFSLFTFWVYFKTGSLIFPIMIHFINNFFVDIITWRILGDIGVFYASVILFLLGVYFLHKVSAKEKSG